LTHKEDAVNVKQLLFYFRFGSTNKKSNINYLALLKDKTLINLYDYENTPMKPAKKEYAKGLRIAHQYQIKEIYWKQNSQSSTTKARRRIFDDITKLKAEISYLNNSGKNQNTKNTLTERFKKLMNDEQFAKLNKACYDRNDHKIKILMEKLHLHHEAENICAYFQTFRIEKKKFLSWEDKNDMIKTCKRIYENRLDYQTNERSLRRKCGIDLKDAG
jgi:hypothetical protein